MIILDLKPLVFLAMLALIGSGLLAVWLDRRTRRIRRPVSFFQWSDNPPDIQPAFDAAPFGFMLLNAPDTYLYANAYAGRLLSLDISAGQLPSEPWCDLLREDIRAAIASDLTASDSYRVVNLKSDQQIRWWVHALSGLYLVLLIDISSQWKIEQAYHAFVSNLSHEVRTPLTAILTHLEVLRTPEVPEATRAQSLELIDKEANRITRLVRDLSELNRLEIMAEIAQRPIDPLVLVEEAMAQVILKAEERQLTLSLQAEASLPRVLGDPDRLKQVFLNILDNAVKYCRPGDQVEVGLRIESDGIGCTINDTGPGIPSQHLPYVTHRLYRARTDVEGSGLGLSLVEEILRRHQSQLEIESQSEGEQTGTRIHFVLPVLPVESKP